MSAVTTKCGKYAKGADEHGGAWCGAVERAAVGRGAVACGACEPRVRSEALRAATMSQWVNGKG